MSVDGSNSAARRRRRRATAAQGTPAAPSQPVVEPEPKREPQRKAAKRRPDAGERALRDLVGNGSSQLGLSAALRARDVNRPTDDDLAAAERETVIVRRNWRAPT